MSGNKARLEAISAVINYQPISAPLNFADTPTGELFGANVFNTAVMKKRLPKGVYKSLMRTIEQGEPLDMSTADAVANGMKDWAISKGATHYAHVFYPLTGRTAEKHDSFLSPNGGNSAVAEFSGAQLIQGEPDGSSFPTGGLRPTFEARGYTAWDVTSPAYILENANGTTLCIPTAFVSWSGEALGKKTPMLRSMKALNVQTQRILNLFGDDDGSLVSTSAGAEQEYFLIDQNFYYARPDLLNAGRTLFGAPSPKGQELDDHYFGAIPARVLACMLEVEQELFKLGVPIKTRHNEVAPGQYELAPVYENANVATDHQQLTMTTLSRVAAKYGMTCLMHEKPFAGVNGSGKHVNFSFGSATQGNLLEPGDTPQNNARFLIFCAAIIRAVDKYAPLLRSVVASAGNDHRLGANEAPPAIISIFLGDQLTEVFEQIKAGGPKPEQSKDILNIGVDTLPPLPRHSGDRNRTSPLAFTGNKFEFRAVGSNQSIAGPLMVMNSIVTESLDYIATKLEANEGDFDLAVQAVLHEIMVDHGRIIFNGDGYADAWQEEAAARGLPNFKTTVEALPASGDAEAIALYGKYAVMNEREVTSRLEVYSEQYVMAINVEAKLMVEMAQTMIYPAALRYQTELATSAASVKALGLQADTELLAKLMAEAKGLNESVAILNGSLAHHADSLSEEVAHMGKVVVPAMAAVRAHADALEAIVADDMWPLPTYQEMMFIK